MILTTNQTIFFNVVISPRATRLIHIRIIAIGCKIIESTISRKSFIAGLFFPASLWRLRSL